MKLIPENPEELIYRIKSRPLVLYGMGYIGKLIAGWCDSQGLDYIFADRDTEEKKKETSKVVISSEDLAKYPDANIVITSINYYDEIKTNLNQTGIEDERILSFLLFWPKKIDWCELEKSADWKAVRLRAERFSKWVDDSAELVVDYSAEKNYLRDFLQPGVKYVSMNYIRAENGTVFADFTTRSRAMTQVNADVSSCIAVLMCFKNPEELVRHICETTRKSVILSYVTIEKLPYIDFRRSINYVNDFTELEILAMFSKEGFIMQKKETDPFDEVHTVYLFERMSNCC